MEPGVAKATETCDFPLQECPTGLVDEDTFKLIYSQFFPQGGKSKARQPHSPKAMTTPLFWGGCPMTTPTFLATPSFWEGLMLLLTYQRGTPTGHKAPGRTV